MVRLWRVNVARSHCPYREAARPIPGRISLGKGRNYSQSMKFTRDLIIVNYFKWKMLDTLVVGKRHRESERERKRNKPWNLLGETQISQQGCLKGSYLETAFQALGWGRRGKGWGRGEPTASQARSAPASSAVLANLAASSLSLHTNSCLRQRSQPRLSLVLVTASCKNLLFLTWLQILNKGGHFQREMLQYSLHLQKVFPISSAIYN